MNKKRNEGQLFRLHGSTDMRVESRVRVGDEMYGLKKTIDLGFS